MLDNHVILWACEGCGKKQEARNKNHTNPDRPQDWYKGECDGSVHFSVDLCSLKCFLEWRKKNLGIYTTHRFSITPNSKKSIKKE